MTIIRRMRVEERKMESIFVGTGYWDSY